MKTALLDCTFPGSGGRVLHREELMGGAFCNGLFWLPAGGSKKDGSEERAWLSVRFSSQRSLEASLTGMEFNCIACVVKHRLVIV